MDVVFGVPIGATGFLPDRIPLGIEEIADARDAVLRKFRKAPDAERPRRLVVLC